MLITFGFSKPIEVNHFCNRIKFDINAKYITITSSLNPSVILEKGVEYTFRKLWGYNDTHNVDVNNIVNHPIVTILQENVEIYSFTSNDIVGYMNKPFIDEQLNITFSKCISYNTLVNNIKRNAEQAAKVFVTSLYYNYSTLFPLYSYNSRNAIVCVDDIWCINKFCVVGLSSTEIMYKPEDQHCYYTDSDTQIKPSDSKNIFFNINGGI